MNNIAFQEEVLDKYAPAYANDTSRMRKNLLKLEIFYRDFNFQQITEKPSYTVGFDIFCNDNKTIIIIIMIIIHSII